MTTLENALWMFGVLLGVLTSGAAFTKAKIDRTRIRRERARFDALAARARADAAHLKRQQAEMRDRKAVEHMDYCAGCDKITLRKSMRWSVEGTWRCRECCPDNHKLSDEIAAAADALDETTHAAMTIPIIASVPQSYIDRNATVLAYGQSVDGTEWSLWKTLGQAKLYASEQQNARIEIVREGPNYRVNVTRMPRGWQPTNDADVWPNVVEHSTTLSNPVGFVENVITPNDAERLRSQAEQLQQMLFEVALTPQHVIGDDVPFRTLADAKEEARRRGGTIHVVDDDGELMYRVTGIA